VGPRSSLDQRLKEKSFAPAEDQTLIVKSVTKHYTDGPIMTHLDCYHIYNCHGRGDNCSFSSCTWEVKGIFPKLLQYDTKQKKIQIKMLRKVFIA
jgi:hypothetical protein